MVFRDEDGLVILLMENNDDFSISLARKMQVKGSKGKSIGLWLLSIQVSDVVVVRNSGFQIQNPKIHLTHNIPLPIPC